MKVGDFDIKISPLHGGTEIKGEGIAFDKLTLAYYHHQIPKASISYISYTNEPFLAESEYKVTADLGNGQQLDFDFFAPQREFENRRVTLTGLTCQAEYVMLSQTIFLGESLTDALGTLNKEFTVNIQSPVSGQFYCINETAYDATRRLLRGCSPDKIWEFTESSIELINPSKTEKMETATLIKTDTMPITIDKSEPVKAESSFGNFGWNKSEQVESMSPAFVDNFIKATKIEKSYDLLYTIRTDYQLPNIMVGSTVKVELPTVSMSTFGVIGKVVTIEKQHLYTDFIVGANL